MTAPTSSALPAQAPTAASFPASVAAAFPTQGGAPADLPVDPLPLPQPGWGAAQARAAVAEAVLALPGLAGPAELVRAVSTVVFRVGACAVKVHPPGTDPAHLARVHAVLTDSPVALTALAAPVVTSHGVVTVTPWTPPAPPLGWTALGEVLRVLHDLPTADRLPSWQPLRRLPAQLVDLGPAAAQAVLDRRADVLQRLAALPPVLRPGALHGDVAPDNVLATPSGPRWIDLDFASTGLREYDLAAVVRRRARGEISERDYQGFVDGYGIDLRGWAGLVVLDELCALSGLGFRLWADRSAGRASGWLPGELARLRPVPAGR